MRPRLAVLSILAALAACKAKSAGDKRAAPEDKPASVGNAGSAHGGEGGSGRTGGSKPDQWQHSQGSGSSDGNVPGKGDPTRPLDHRRPVTDEVGQVVAVGSLDHSIIRRSIKKKLPDVNKCYEDAVAAKPALEGAIVAEFTIRPDGTVADAKSNGVDEALGRCVAQIIQGIQFPKPKNGDKVTVKYPFQFRLSSTDTGSGSN